MSNGYSLSPQSGYGGYLNIPTNAPMAQQAYQSGGINGAPFGTYTTAGTAISPGVGTLVGAGVDLLGIGTQAYGRYQALEMAQKNFEEAMKRYEEQKKRMEEQDQLAEQQIGLQNMLAGAQYARGYQKDLRQRYTPYKLG